MGRRQTIRWWRWRREMRPLATLAFPIMSGMLSQMLIGLTDTLMVGRVGVVELAAASFVHTITHVPLVFAFGLLSSIGVLTAQAFGAKQPGEAGEVLRHGLLVSAGCGIGTFLVLLCIWPFLHIFGQPTDVVREARPFLLLFGASMIPGLIAHGCKQFSEALNKPWAATLILLGGVALNAFLNWVFIYGNLGAPALKLQGSGLATLISRTIMAACLFAYVLCAADLRPFHPLNWWSRLKRDTIVPLLRLGWPVATQHLLEVGAFVIAALMIGWISADAIAAHQVAITCAATTFMFPLGLGMATCVRVGQAWGAGQYLRLRRIGWLGITWAGVMMAFFGVVFVFGRDLLAAAFLPSSTVRLLAAQLLLVAAVFQIADGIQVAAISALRGLGDVRIPAVIAALAYWFVAVPLGSALAFGAKQGAVGMWIGLATGLLVAAIGLSWRFHRKTVALKSAKRPLRDIAPLPKTEELVT